ncbi:MAG: hypothetical protein QOE68_841 [Thermoanaerobaculia bacterium]|jgi:hypothetical protein|nr:hypothetical protein [Thermoanaerobaculia bacterium]
MMKRHGSVFSGFSREFKADGTPPKKIRVNDLLGAMAGNPDGAANFVM